ncbi:MAG: phage integrase SAM-like domain-containing protein [Dokdonia sp.]|jgi:integrase
MASIKYEVIGKSTNAPIHLRLSVKRGITPRCKTGLFINPKQWSDKTKLPNQNVAKNKNLTTELLKLKVFILERCNEVQRNGDLIDKEWLQHSIDLFFKRVTEDKQSDRVKDAIQDIIDDAGTRKNSKGGLGLSKSRINSYKSLKRIISEYPKAKNLKVKQVNIRFAKEFLKWLTNDKGYAESYAVKKIADLKTVCFDAEVNGVEVHHQLKKISHPKKNNENIIYLSNKELEKIQQIELNNGALDNARKWLLLGCNIGQRGNDLLSINEDNFKIRNGLHVIELTQQKTNKNVTIPVLETTKTILEYGLPYKISIQKFNNYIKQVCKLAGIDEVIYGGKITVLEKGKGISNKRKIYGQYPKWQLIGSHVCRRSFASNLYGILPTPLIMSITAHSTEKMLLNYIGKQGLDYAQQIADYYRLQAMKDNREPTLTVVQKKAL